MIRLVIVLINYYKEHELSEFVKKNLLKQNVDGLHIIVYDNGSHQPEVIRELLHDKRVTILSSGKNLGYFGAANAAFVEFCGANNFIPDVFIVSNFDLQFDPLVFLESVFRTCEYSDAAVIGPSIVSSLNGAELNPIYRSRLSLSHLNRLLFVTSSLPLFIGYQFLHYAKRSLSNGKSRVAVDAKHVYAIHGSFMIFKRIFFERGCTLNYDSFLYGEELFVAEQCRLSGLAISVDMNLKVIHDEHTTTGKFKGRKHMKWLNDSISFIKRKFYNG